MAGATGTGKTKTLQLIAEQLSAAGVPVLMADVKGDLSGLSSRGRPTTRPPRAPRTPETTGRRRPTRSSSCRWAPRGRRADPGDRRQLRPVLLSKVLGLNATQESTLGLIFHWAKSRPSAGRPWIICARHKLPDRRRGQGRTESTGRGVADDARASSCGPGEPRGLRAVTPSSASPSSIRRTCCADDQGRGIISLLEFSGESSARSSSPRS